MNLTKRLRVFGVALATAMAFTSPAVLAQDAAAAAARKQEMQALGTKSGSAWALYQALKAQAAASGAVARPATRIEAPFGAPTR